MKKLLLGVALAALAAGSAYAQDIKPGVVFDLGGKFDKSFNEGVFNGASKFKTETGIEFREFEMQNDAHARRRSVASPRMASRRSSSPAS